MSSRTDHEAAPTPLAEAYLGISSAPKSLWPMPAAPAVHPFKDWPYHSSPRGTGTSGPCSSTGAQPTSVQGSATAANCDRTKFCGRGQQPWLQALALEKIMATADSRLSDRR